MALLVTVLRSFLESELSQLGTEWSKIAKDAAEFLLENSHHPAWKEPTKLQVVVTATHAAKKREETIHKAYAPFFNTNTYTNYCMETLFHPSTKHMKRQNPTKETTLNLIGNKTVFKEV